MACGKRRFHPHKRSQSTPAIFVQHSPVKHRKQWSNIQTEKAMEVMKSGTDMKVNYFNIIFVMLKICHYLNFLIGMV